MKDGQEGCLDPQLWHACAGGMVQMPAVRSHVYYFSQGHAEHSHGPAADLAAAVAPRALPALVLCRVAAVRFLADPDTDEVFAKIRLVPVRSGELEFPEEEGARPPGPPGSGPADAREKLASFAKTLTQSDANNGGGFSVPRYCAETIFPRLDYSRDPPVQMVIATDVHGDEWNFRHIYRGTPRRHLLTTGWSVFVNKKKLVAGDSIVFLRGEHGELHVGIRRAKRVVCGEPECISGWNAPGFGGFSAFLKEEESKLMKSPGVYMRGRGKVKMADVVEAATLAANGQPFEVVYYPRACTPEFVVNAVTVQDAMRIQWCPGMRFKMPFEMEDSSRISWFMGTVSSVQVNDPNRWPNSPWRLLQVTWDEPDLLQNVKFVNPWLVDLVSSIPPIHLASFSPPRKKF